MQSPLFPATSSTQLSLAKLIPFYNLSKRMGRVFIIQMIAFYSGASLVDQGNLTFKDLAIPDTLYNKQY
jgi:hypothetical protein